MATLLSKTNNLAAKTALEAGRCPKTKKRIENIIPWPKARAYTNNDKLTKAAIENIINHNNNIIRFTR